MVVQQIFQRTGARKNELVKECEEWGLQPRCRPDVEGCVMRSRDTAEQRETYDL